MRFSLLAVVVFAVPAAAGIAPPIPRGLVPAAVLRETPLNDGDTPEALAARIAKRSTEVGGRLAEKDAGDDTRSEQSKLKADLDALIKALEQPPPPMNPPPMPPPDSPPPPMPNDGNPPPKSDSPMPNGGNPPPNSDSPMPNGGNPPPPGTGQNPPPGDGPKPRGRKPRPDGGEPKDAKSGDSGNPTPTAKTEKPGGPASPGKPGGPPPPALPPEESIAREFWGNLPDQTRQRMMQFFREQYMSRYKDLLPQYYQSLAEKETKGKKP